MVRARIGEVTVLGVYGAASDPVRYASRAQRDRKRAWLREFVDLVDAECRADASPLLLAGDLNIVDPADRAGLPYVLAQEREAYEHLLGLGLLDAFRHATGGSTPTWIDHTGSAAATTTCSCAACAWCPPASTTRPVIAASATTAPSSRA